MPEKKKGVVPRLRFPEFRDAGEWEVKRFWKVYSFYPTNSFSRDKLIHESGTIKNIHYGDIHKKFSVLFDITKEQVPYLNPLLDIEKLNNEAYCREGDIILADASEDIDDIGKSIEIVNLNGEKLVSGLHTIMARQKSPKLIIGFGGYLFRTAYIREQIKREAQGAKVLEISPKRLSEISVIYPNIKAEQQKIAGCLSSLDKVIDLEAQKLEALKAHKKGLMQQLFPREGETAPRLRFPEFRNAGEWKKCRFRELLTLEYGVSLPERSRLDGVIPIVGSNGVVGFHNQALIPGPVIVVGRKGSAGEINWIESDCYPIDTTFYVKPKLESRDMLLFFIKLLLENTNLKRLSDNGAVPGINRNDVYVLKTALPLGDEQQKISDCISSLDEMIDLEAQKLEALKAHKKGLMQQLFPQEMN